MVKFIGIGACGNKAIADLVTNNVIAKKDALMLNSTKDDIPVDFQDIAVKVGSGLGGCGKERSKGKEVFLTAIQKDQLDHLDEFITTADTVYVIASSEGGTGSGAAPVIASYYKSVYGIEVHIVVFTGFEDDARGLANTIEFFQEIPENTVVHAISNKKFLAEANGNKLKAEKKANQHLRNMITVLLGSMIVNSDQNIDETDLFKVVNTPGYSIVETAIINREIKNHEAFNKLLSDTIDGTKAIDIEDPACKRIAFILNISDKTADAIDFTFDVVKHKLGTPYEIFYHVQNEGDAEYVSMIITGMDMPTTELKEIHKRYLEATSRVNREVDIFSKVVGSMLTDNDEFNVTANTSKPKMDKSAFLNGFTETKTNDVVVKKDAFKKF
jgi:cell division protein FtsZ